MFNQPDFFDIIVSEICQKQNGIPLKQGDHREVRDLFVRKNGDIEALINGVLPQFDLLKACILECFRAGRIGSTAPEMRSTISVDVNDIQRQKEEGRRVAIALAKQSLGEDLLFALIRSDP